MGNFFYAGLLEIMLALKLFTIPFPFNKICPIDLFQSEIIYQLSVMLLRVEAFAK